VSCRQEQTTVAKKAAAAAGISATSSQTAGEVAGGGAGPTLATNQPRRPRAVRQATKTYRKLPLKKKKKLWAAVGQAALATAEKEKQYRLNRAVRDFGRASWRQRWPRISARPKKSRMIGRSIVTGSWPRCYRRQPRRRECRLKPKRDRVRQPKARTDTRKKANGDSQSQARFFQQNSATGKPANLPARHRIDLADTFNDDELQPLSTQLLLGSAAARRQLKLLSGGASRGIGHSDPRVRDWVEQDRNNFRFLSEQVSQARRGQNGIDLSALKDSERVDLWEFSKFEADRALRNIDHLQSGWSHLKGPTAAYLTGQHQLEARFFTHLAAQLEPTLTTAMRDEAGVIEVG
jgi:hypothetical protein